MMRAMHIKRLQPGDEALAAAMFSMMVEVFEEGDPSPLPTDYVRELLGRVDFWAVAALEDEEPIGGLTAHRLPMTRSKSSELFIYDIAVRADRQRRGVGRALVAHLVEEAKKAGIDNAFVPADDEDTHALDFYRALGGAPAKVTMFTFEV